MFWRVWGAFDEFPYRLKTQRFVTKVGVLGEGGKSYKYETLWKGPWDHCEDV